MVSKNIVLVGFMGTGKTSVGKVLGKKLGREVVDIDHWIESSRGKTIREIFETVGEAHFRLMENEAIGQITGQRGIVITAGGGAVLDAQNIAAFKKTGWLVTLWAAPETIEQRVRHSRNRPLLKNGNRLDEIKKILAERKSFYEKGDFHFHTDGLTPAQVAKNILEALKDKLIL